ncbi:MAG: phosphoribosylglycinamide synthetase C domain-containing protein, partial [Propionibacteriaceae bacterium]
IGSLRWKPESAVAVVLASAGYPAASRSGDLITGADHETESAYVVHAGTAIKDGQLVSAGGRVLASVGVGADLDDARRSAYDRLAQVGLADAQFRTDIAQAAAGGQIPTPTVKDSRA